MPRDALDIINRGTPPMRCSNQRSVLRKEMEIPFEKRFYVRCAPEHVSSKPRPRIRTSPLLFCMPVYYILRDECSAVLHHQGQSVVPGNEEFPATIFLSCYSRLSAISPACFWLDNNIKETTLLGRTVRALPPFPALPVVIVDLQEDILDFIWSCSIHTAGPLEYNIIIITCAFVRGTIYSVLSYIRDLKDR